MIKLRDLIVERKKANMNLYKKVVKALKDIPVRASIHLDVDGDLTVNLLSLIHI